MILGPVSGCMNVVVAYLIELYVEAEYRNGIQEVKKIKVTSEIFCSQSIFNLRFKLIVLK